MAEFFQINPGEVKTIRRDTRILADNVLIPEGMVYPIQTQSFAPLQKLKFFLDALRVYDVSEDESLVFRIGEYYELEHAETIQLFNSSGFYNIQYTCTENDGNGLYNMALTIEPIAGKELTLYVSNVNIEDSFYTPIGGWTNPANPDNLNDEIIAEENPGLPPDANPDDFLVFDAIDGPKWKPGEETVEFLPYPQVPDSDALPDPIEARRGPVNIDGQKMLIDVDGFIEPNIDHDTLYYDDDDQSPTFGMLKAKGGGGVDYSTGEQDTGLKWINGKSVYQKSFEKTLSSDILLAGSIETLIEVSGWVYDNTNTGYPIHVTDTFARGVMIDSAGALKVVLPAGWVLCRGTVKYTKP